MDPHPDFAGLNLPRTFDLPGFRLTPLSPPHVDEDHEAVMSSADVLMDLFGDWSSGLTREDDLIDLAWHEREFTLRRSFSWIVRSRSGDYLGCAYLFPAQGRTGQASVVTWIRDIDTRADCHARLKRELKDWCTSRIPANIDLNWS